ncbi:MAG: hypothetical protein J0L92_36500 [Deltaproteobacteria bacterium]|nr:hypothetical protein [Deltaproteobacteria bacterium]
MALATLVVMSATSPARADAPTPSSEASEEASTPEPAASTPPESSQAYRETINAAVAEFAEGHHAEARALFRRAHAMRPNARTLRGIGMCAFELREYAEAVRALSASLTDTRRPLTDEQRVQVESALERANAFVGRFEVDAPEGALLFVDGAAAPTELEADGTLLLTLGAHVVAARRDDTSLGEVRVEVRGGEREPLVIARERERVTPPIVDATPTRTPDLVPGIVLIASGGALLLGGAILFGVGLSDAATVEGARSGTAWSTLEGAYGRAPVLQGVGAASLGVGVALAATGGILLGLEGATGSAHARTDVVRVEVSLGGLLLRGSF